MTVLHSYEVYIKMLVMDYVFGIQQLDVFYSNKTQWKEVNTTTSEK